MAKDLFNRYIWLVDTIYRAGKITFEEINEKWQRNEMSEGEDMSGTSPPTKVIRGNPFHSFHRIHVHYAADGTHGFFI